MKRIRILLATVTATVLIMACADPVGTLDDGNEMVSEKTVILQDGLAGYSGTDDTTIYVDESDWSGAGIAGDPPTASEMTSRFNDRQTPSYRAMALVRFDVSGLTSNMLSTSETCADNIEVMRATVELKGRIGSSTSLVYFTPLDLTAPAWTEEGANWTEASSGVDWSGTTNDPLSGDRYGVSDAREGWGNSAVYQSVFFNLPTEIVKEWICDPSKNQGFVIRNILFGFSRFYTSEYSIVSERPKLVMVLKKN
jgi:hypothetical protein